MHVENMMDEKLGYCKAIRQFEEAGLKAAAEWELYSLQKIRKVSMSDTVAVTVRCVLSSPPKAVEEDFVDA